MPSETELPERCVIAKNYSTLTHPLLCFKVVPEMAQQVFFYSLPKPSVSYAACFEQHSVPWDVKTHHNIFSLMQNPVATHFYRNHN